MKYFYIIFLTFLLVQRVGFPQGYCPANTSNPPVFPNPNSAPNNTLQLQNGQVIQTEGWADLTPENILWINNYMANNFPNADKIACPSSKYNCHGYAWHLAFGGAEEKWINSNQIAKFYTPYNNNDEYFYEVSSVPLYTRGVAVYYNNSGDITHSAVVIENTNAQIYRSKWGYNYKVQHAPLAVEGSYGIPTKFYLPCGNSDNLANLSNMTYNYGKPVCGQKNLKQNYLARQFKAIMLQ